MNPRLYSQSIIAYMSDRLLQTAQKMEEEDSARNILNRYFKVQKQSDEITKRASKKNPYPYDSRDNTIGTKDVSSQDILRMIKKPLQVPPTVQKSKKTPVQPMIIPNTKARITSLKSQINQQQKQTSPVSSKEEAEYMLFRFKLLAKRVVGTEAQMERHLVKSAFQSIRQGWERVRQLEAKFTMKRYKRILRKYFDNFYKQTIILKLEREKQEQKLELHRRERNDKLAVDYREFSLCRRALKIWQIWHVRQTAQRQKHVTVQKLKEESGLRSKLQDFLSKMQENINPPDVEEPDEESDFPGQNNTIKEVFEQSIDSREADWANQRPQQDNPNPDNATTGHSQQVPRPQTKKLNNEDLLRKRQELQGKNKQRKQVLDKLRKEKQELKQRGQQEKKLQQQKQRVQEKRRRQEQHQLFVEKKKEDEERRRKEEADRRRADELYVQAQTHTKNRIMKYSGLLPWKKLITIRNQKTVRAVGLVERVRLSGYWRCFLEGYAQRDKQITDKENIKLWKATQHYKSNMNKKIIQIIKEYNNTEGKEQRKFLSDFRDSHALREALDLWRRALPLLRQQNYKLDSENNKLVERFRYCYLTKHYFQAFRKNKEEQQRQKRILQHKTRLKQKMEEIMGPSPQLDISKLL